MTRRDYTYGSAGDCTITFDLLPPEGRIVAPTGSMHLDLAALMIYTKAEGTEDTGWQALAGGGGGLPDGDYGDVSISGDGTLITVNDAAITYDKIQDVSQSQVVLGRISPGAGDIEEIPFDTLAAALGIDPNSVTGNYRISGGGVAWVSGLTFAVTAASYVIGGVQYASPPALVTLVTADATNPRIDVIAVNTSSVVEALTGTPNPNPKPADVDPETQLLLTFIYVPAGATAPTVVVTVIYRENAEWTTTRSGAPITLASTNNPYAGTVCIEGTNATTNNWAQFAAPVAFDPNTFDALVLHVRSKALWPSTRQLNLNLRTGANNKGATVVLKNGTYGFNSATTADYQTVVIPMTDFGAGGLLIDSLRVTVSGSGAAIGFYLDNLELQTGVQPPVSTGETGRMRWRGDWLAAISYSTNDVVLYSDGIQYVALQDGSGNIPSTATAYWQDSSSTGAGTNAAKGCTVKRTTTFAMTTANAEYAFPFDTEIRDDENYWTVSDPAKITISVTGWYILTGSWTGESIADTVTTFFRVNGTAFNQAGANHVSRYGQTTAVSMFGHAAAIEYLTAGDYVELVGISRSGGNDIAGARASIARFTGTTGATGATGATGPASSIMRGAAFQSDTVLSTTQAAVSVAFNKTCTLNRVVCMGDVNGTCEVSLKKSTIAAANGGTGGTSITGSDPPGISAANYSDKTSFTGWTLGFVAGDVLNIGLVSTSNFGRLTVQIFVE